MYSVMIARYKFFPEVKTKGMAAAPRLVLFTSEHVSPTLYLHHKAWQFISSVQIHPELWLLLQSHYSIKKASAALGFGTENLILLSTDKRFALYRTHMHTVWYNIKHLDDLLCLLLLQRESHSCWFGSQSNRGQAKGECQPQWLRQRPL